LRAELISQERLKNRHSCAPGAVSARFSAEKILQGGFEIVLGRESDALEPASFTAHSCDSHPQDDSGLFLRINGRRTAYQLRRWGGIQFCGWRNTMKSEEFAIRSTEGISEDLATCARIPGTPPLGMHGSGTQHREANSMRFLTLRHEGSA
jgi:hypothetical protein